MGEFGQVSVAPGIGKIKPAFEDRGMAFSHNDEVSTPYYYKVTMDAGEQRKIVAETTATSRVGYLRFTFDGASRPHVLVQATRETIEGEITVSPEQQEIYGKNPERQDHILGPFEAKNFNGYFVARFDQKFTAWGTAANATVHANKTSMTSTGLSAYAQFAEGTKNVTVRVGVSLISIEQARTNLENEIPEGTSLEDASSKVQSQWSEKLDRVQVEGANEEQRTILYTGMFHSLQVRLSPLLGTI
jgi:putative alpha-1,2-mannosidase